MTATVPARSRHRKPAPLRRPGAWLRLAGLVSVACTLAVWAVPLGDAGRYGLPLDRSPDSTVARALAVAASTAPAPERRALTAIGRKPLATWLLDPDAVGQVRRIVSGAARRHAVPILVLYRIPERDCGSYSGSGGAASDAEYRTWLRLVLAGLHRHRALVILEPDALAQLDCLDPATAAARIHLLRWAVGQVVAQGSWLYVDAGHAGWVPARVMAERLRAVGAERATGFSLNVANFGDTTSETAYGRELVRRTGGRLHFVIDTSRNGARVPQGRWCNPPGSRLGPAPTVHTADPLVDAYLWVKTPGASDGPCNGGPPAGTVWPAYALALMAAGG